MFDQKTGVYLYTSVMWKLRKYCNSTGYSDLYAIAVLLLQR